MSEIEKKSKFISNISSNLSNEDNENDENYYNEYENSDTELNKEVKIIDEIHINLLNYVSTTINHKIIPLCEYLTIDMVLEFVEEIQINKKSLLYYLDE
jgi:hypothetical protein